MLEKFTAAAEGEAVAAVAGGGGGVWLAEAGSAMGQEEIQEKMKEEMKEKEMRGRRNKRRILERKGGGTLWNRKENGKSGEARRSHKGLGRFKNDPRGSGTSWLGDSGVHLGGPSLSAHQRKHSSCTSSIFTITVKVTAVPSFVPIVVLVIVILVVVLVGL